MPRIRSFSSLWWLAGPPLLALSCSHDAPRDNPLDPTLTPPVELQAALDDTAGTATLTWTRYEGEAEFGEYLVLRQVFDRVAVDTLGRPAARDSSAHIDTTVVPGTSYIYRVSVVNAGGLEATSPEVRVRPLSLPAVEIQSLELDSRTATAALSWTPYRGPRFRAYQVRRRTEKLAATVVAELTDSTAASWVDSGLAGATDYYYRVAVVTERGEEVVSPEVVGGIHRLVDTWPLELEIAGRTMAGGVRLYAEPGDRIAVLAVDNRSARIVWYGRSHGQIEERHLAFIPRREDLFYLIGDPFTPSNMAMGLHPLGMRCLSLSTGGTGTFGIVPLGADESPVLKEWLPFAGDVAWALDETESTVLGEIRLGAAPGEHALFDQVAVTVAGRTVFADDFGAYPETSDQRDEQREQIETVLGWSFRGSHGFGGGWAVLFGVLHGLHEYSQMSRADPTWRDFGLAADLVAFKSGYIEMGGATYSRLRLALDAWAKPPRLELAWTFLPPEGLEQPAREDKLTSSSRFLPGMLYRLGLEAAEGEVGVTVRGPTAWIDTLREHPQFGSLVAIGEGLALTFDEQAFSVDAKGEITRLASLESWVSETRAWQIPGERLPRIGVCLPGQNRIRTGTFLRASAWTQGLRTSLGPFIEQRSGFLDHPVSFDVSLDGRVYVLDAGNARVVSFDADGKYITEWGGVGAGDGQFNFGYGGRKQRGLDFVGSICVDDEGYIHVADVFNQRIQVFAP